RVASAWWGLARAYEAQHDSLAAEAAYTRFATLTSEPERGRDAVEKLRAMLRREGNDSPASADAFARAFEQLTVEVVDPPSGGTKRFWALTRPLFLEARNKGHVEALAYELSRQAQDSSAEAWLVQHVEKSEACRAWLEPLRRAAR